MEPEKPEWFKQKLSADREQFDHIRQAVQKRGLNTVCEESSCPNIEECWSQEGTATFMVLGDTCTRNCGFCDVNTGNPGEDSVDPLEPAKLAGAIEEIGLSYAVITSVDRDDLDDQGSEHFARCIKAIKARDVDTKVEVLVPDFRGDEKCIRRIIRAGPEVIAHNIETTRELQEEIRDQRAGYYQSLSVLEKAKKYSNDIYTKSSIMLGLGEKEENVLQAMDDLRGAGVDILTLGQYLRPSEDHVEIDEYVEPEKFEWYKEKAEEKGFKFVAAGPFVRSSYRAGEKFVENIIEKGVEPDPVMSQR